MLRHNTVDLLFLSWIIYFSASPFLSPVFPQTLSDLTLFHCHLFSLFQFRGRTNCNGGTTVTARFHRLVQSGWNQTFSPPRPLTGNGILHTFLRDFHIFQALPKKKKSSATERPLAWKIVADLKSTVAFGK